MNGWCSKKCPNTKKNYSKLRIQRVVDAINLKEPDRVPFIPQMNPHFMSNQAGINQKTAWYNGRKNLPATIKVSKKYDWDLYPGTTQAGFGHFYDALRIQNFKWPGAKDPDLACLTTVHSKQLKENQ